ncbi:MAG: BREX-2 system adenine-specific DNA-methyltransferase PglX [Deltaproteobacteria bacterium]|nr:BREX-2 system adenine-specific DNA-methyltransferase PglX [Deltaproteobacteria bacterium]
MARGAGQRKKVRLEELPGQADPRAALDGAGLLRAAQPVLKVLNADLLARAKGSPAVRAALEARHAADRAARRTADSFLEWQGRFIAQVGAAWLLSCVFVRTLEDRGLLGRARLAGPGAADSQRLFFELAPSLTERDYLLTVFRELCGFPAARDLFDARHNPVWLLAPSAEAAKALLSLFRTPTIEAPALRFGQADTRFLGDLYQDLDPEVKERFALLQTPRFVEAFILDRTLEPALSRFGLDETQLIDPTCGSGHFLLGAFERLYHERLRAEPGLEPREAARRALDAVFGADLNPYAVAIARVRLTLAFLEKAGYARLADAPALPLHLVVADSLLHNPHLKQTSFGDRASTKARPWHGAEWALEDEAGAREVLYRRYAAVVGNPPYITVKDAALRERYRESYRSAAGKYSLAVPFTERFFQLAGKIGGQVGMITANSFMKREFGTKLIEEVLPTVNLELIVNTSGAYIPGHGTPTVLLFGTAEPPQGSDVLTVLASRGEPSTPEDPEQGLVWRSVADHFLEVGFENDYISVARVARTDLAKHPWSLGGGGAAELKALLEERAEKRLGDVAQSIGISSFTLEDEVYLRAIDAWRRIGVPPVRLRPMVIGEAIRDWVIGEVPEAFFPYESDLEPAPDDHRDIAALWPFRTSLANNKLFGGKTKVEGGLKWYEYGRLTADKLRTPLSIAFAFVATHNHFVLDRGGKVFNRSAPIIKLPASATEDDHLALLAYLNSSTACFWMKQVCMPKGMNNTSEANATPYLVRYEFDGTKVGNLPIPPGVGERGGELIGLARAMVEIQDRRQAIEFARLIETTADHDELGVKVVAAIAEREALLRRLVALQEELDWLTYEMFGLLRKGDHAPVESVAGVPLGARPFEVQLAEAVVEPGVKSYFAWHGTQPRPDAVRELGPTQRATYESRGGLLSKNAEIRLLESPENKRRWLQPAGKAAQEVETDAKILHDQAVAWLEVELEQLLRSASNGRAVSRAELVRAVQKHRGMMITLAWQHAGSAEVKPWLEATMAEESVPYIAALRYSRGGMEKRALWEATWELQRREDMGTGVAEIPVPPKYTPEDFADSKYFRLRGPLDVPKERFIAYPGCASDEDGEPLYGWAGWNHLERAQALAALYNDRKTREGWSRDRLTPLLAGLLELVPWLKQWHNAPDPEFDGLRLGDYFEGFLDGQGRELSLTHEELQAWRPTETKGRGKRGAGAGATREKQGEA